MSLNITEDKRINEIVENVREYSVLVDNVGVPGSVEGLPCAPGLGMHTEAVSLQSLYQDLEDGVFKTLVMGKFKNGKSTFINSMLGDFVMAAKATATTAVIAMVEYGSDEKKVRLYKNGKKTPIEMSLERFTEEYKLTEEDEQFIESGGTVDRFADVDYAVMQSSQEMFREGVKLIDSPGLEEAVSRDKTTKDFVPKTNAIIFVMNATALFSQKEVDYIHENFAYKEMRNVFFVVNRINQLTEDPEISVYPSVKKGLECVFTDADGKFDQDLYNKRVFYVDAYGALCARTGAPYKVRYGRKEVVGEIALEDTGMVEFEEELSAFLNSDERIHAMFQSTLSSMANIYFGAKNKVESNGNARNLPLEELEQKEATVSKKLEELKDEAESMKKTISRTGDNIALKVYTSMLAYAQTDIPKTFNSAVENEKVDFGVKGMLGLAKTVLKGYIPGKDKDRIEKEQEDVLKPVTDKVNSYIREQMEEWEKQVPTLIDQDMRDMSEDLGEAVEHFDLGLTETIGVFSTGNVHSDGMKRGNPLQTLIALSNWDVSLGIEALAGDGMRWGDFLKRVGIQLGLDLGVALVFGAPLLVPALIIEAVSMAIRGKQVGKKLLVQIGPKAFENLEKRIRENEMKIKGNIINKFQENGENLRSGALSLVEDQERSLKQILDERKQKGDVARREEQRENTVMDAVRKRLDNVYQAVYGRAPSDDDITRLAKTEKKKKGNRG